ncbi:hypothetical protein H4R21_006688, partial [Coemansia helicoidea]
MLSIVQTAGRRATGLAGRRGCRLLGTAAARALAPLAHVRRTAGLQLPAGQRILGRGLHTAPVARSAADGGGGGDLGDMIPMGRIRNIGIIAHVDHGKTTLVDCLLKQSGALSGSTAMQQTRVMDSNALEKERGITILSKVTSLMYKDHRINIVDTPGHADFGGEVERILSMVDSVVLVVDATEGPMAQTKFVLTKALARGLRPLVVLNKVDRPTSRPDEVDSELLELFLALGASDEQTGYEILYASAKDGWCARDVASAAALTAGGSSAGQGQPAGNMTPLLDAIVRQVPAPTGQREGVP